jgi:hypothetical protein
MNSSSLNPRHHLHRRVETSERIHVVPRSVAGAVCPHSGYMLRKLKMTLHMGRGRTELPPFTSSPPCPQDAAPNETENELHRSLGSFFAV